jgi:hypothetical protein
MADPKSHPNPAAAAVEVGTIGHPAAHADALAW